MKKEIVLFITLIGLIYSNSIHAQSKDFGKIALKRSAIPVHPGRPGEIPFWNIYSKRFIYAPAFNYKVVPNAEKYKYEILSQKTEKAFSFESNVPYAPLSPVWAEIPVGFFKIKVTGIDKNGNSIGLAGEGRYYRAAPFDGPYRKQIMPYDKSAEIALDSLIHRPYVNYWLVHKAPDPNYLNYRYPAKIFSALILGAVTYARLEEDTSEAGRSIKIAEIVADWLIEHSFPSKSALAYFPPTYYGPKMGKGPKTPIKLTNYLIIQAPDAGHAYLDLYDYTKDVKYLQAAKRIAQTFLNTQLDNGSWYLFINHKTGKPTAPNIAIPTAIIKYFDRLRNDYNVKGLEDATERALKWVLNNPGKTFNWQGQFEDVYARPPYKNQSREQACNLAVYLFKHRQNLKLAEELLRYAEDQFVIWDNPRDLWVGKKSESRLGYHSTNWITPCVQEQYVYWMPVTRSAGIMIDAYWQAFVATQKDIYLAKARSIANALEAVQQEYHGNYPTYFTKYPMKLWLNSVVYPARIMMELEQNLKKIKSNAVVFNAGRNGNNTTDLLKRVDEDVLQKSPDVVVMMVGTNDMFNPRNHLSMRRYERNYQRLITIIGKHADLILMTIPPVYSPYIVLRKPQFGFSAEGPRMRVDSANMIIKRLAAINKCTLIDLNDILTSCGGANSNKNGLFQNEANFGIPDGVHPTLNGSRVIATAVYQTIEILRPDARRIVCFGDSITRGYRLKGEGTTEGQCYPAILKRMINL